MAKRIKKWVYFFGKGKAEGRGDDKELLGGKGAGLAEMTRIGLPVPAGFTITTDACATTAERGHWPPGLDKQVRDMLGRLERCCKAKLGDGRRPLLVSVRSGAAVSMPGMMETILNLGLNDVSVEGLAAVAGDRRFAFDAYRRLIMMYGATAKGIDKDVFEDAFDEVKRGRTAVRLGRAHGEKVADTEVDAEELESLVATFKDIYQERCGDAFPQNTYAQLKGAIDAVFGSWMAEKAVTYRRVEDITGLAGTAVNVCQMVFGNMGDDSGTGVCFSRDPSTGENGLYGDLLINAQGEDVVAGVRTPLPLADLHQLMPDVYDQLEAVRAMLEVHYKDMQDLEFTVERGRLYLLQCRAGKRSPEAAFKIAVDQATRGVTTRPTARRLVRKKYLPARYGDRAVKPIITRDEAIQRIRADDIDRLFFPIIDPATPPEVLAAKKVGTGIGAVPGAATGEVVFTAEEAEIRSSQGRSVILVRKETSPEDVGGMYAAVGILTATGGKTSHAAVVARGWGKCCVVGCDELHIDYRTKLATINGKVFSEGDDITLDGGTGRVFEGAIKLVRPSAPREYQTLMGWCDRRRRMRVRTNADTPADAIRAVEFGAEGIGLCRTEHMFFDPTQPQRMRAMREMILADNEPDRRRALDKLLPHQRSDFEGIFAAMHNRPVTIRLLDPPLHEFLPHHDNPEAQQSLADDLNATVKDELAGLAEWETDRRAELETRLVDIGVIRRRVNQLREANPMLGHRGCRLCITFPEILEMQVRAIIEAAVNCADRGVKVLPEIMIPLSIDARELGRLVDRTRSVADEILKARKRRLKYLVGTMVETPRAALTGDRIAEVAEFFSFGTNDLTQFTMALSRDDAGRFLPDYLDDGGDMILDHDPFQSLDVDGVGRLVRMAVENGRGVRADLKLGICGEHGGDPASIAFCHRAGLDYVSCSPFRVPVARLAAAQATITASAADGSFRKAVPRGRRVAGAAGKTRRRAVAKKAPKPSSRAAAKRRTGRTTQRAGAPTRRTPAAGARRKAASGTAATTRAVRRPVRKKRRPRVLVPV
ncbi:MAG: putative PEP-binding protein [Phycisphaerae bacterium]